MEFIGEVKSALPFLDSAWFGFIYGLIVMVNPFAMVPQLISTIRAHPSDLKGVSLTMFFVYLAIQIMVALGAIKALDTVLFVSMFLSAVVTSLVIYFTHQKRREL